MRRPKQRPRIWILEDDPGARFVYDEVLGVRYALDFFLTLSDLRKRLLGPPRPDLVIADLRLPDGSFLDFLGSEESDQILAVPFIVVTSLDDLDILRNCINEGALAYLTKPFGKSTLIHAVESELKTQESAFDYSEDELKLDLVNMKVVIGGQAALSLTPRELQIMTLLLQEKGKFVPRPVLISRVWSDIKVGSKTADVHIFNLRRKLRAIGYEIRSARPSSYSLFQAEDALDTLQTAKSI